MNSVQVCVFGVFVASALVMVGCTHPAEVCERNEMRINSTEETPEGQSVAEIVAPYEGEYDVVATSTTSNDEYVLSVQISSVGDDFEYTDFYATDEFVECRDTMSGELQLTIMGEEGQFNEDVRAELRVDFEPEGEVGQRVVSARIPRGAMQSDFGLPSGDYEALLVNLYIQDGGRVNGYIITANAESDGSARNERVYDVQSPEGEGDVDL